MKYCVYCNYQTNTKYGLPRHLESSHPDRSKIDYGSIKAKYIAHPKKCQLERCSKVLPYYNHKRRRFCNHSCATSFKNSDINNKRRTNNTRFIPFTMKSRFYGPPKPRCCPGCQIKFIPKYSGHKACRAACSDAKNRKAVYRLQCRFKLNPKDHADLYDFDLIRSNGWYSASNSKAGHNPDGVTWDHLYRIEEGFKNHVDPEIMNHPANAEMITWKDNFNRKSSQITLDELKLRIDKWSPALVTLQL
jgi:hypothetical protein